MSDAMAIAASGLKSEEYYIDALANDIANLNTPNYKASKIAFSDMVGQGTTLHHTEKDFSQGPLKPTNQWSDIAIDGHGFYQVQTPEGEVRYTRNSSFTLDDDRYLCTQDGLRLSDDIQIPEDFVSVSVKPSGDVEVTLPNEETPQVVGTITLAKFYDPSLLTPKGLGLYEANDKTGEPMVDNPGTSGLGLLTQNHIESANVDMVSSLMQLTLAQRVYQLNAKALQMADEMEKIIDDIHD